MGEIHNVSRGGYEEFHLFFFFGPLKRCQLTKITYHIPVYFILFMGRFS